MVLGILDLARTERSSHEVASDVCVVGGGAAGLYVTSRLAARGVSVVLLEAGGRVCVDSEQLGFEADVPGGRYRASTAGRAFGVGGTTSSWGGQLIPHSASDVRPGESEATWAHIVSDVSRYGAIVGSALGLGPNADHLEAADRLFPTVAQDARRVGYQVAVSTWLPFTRRNLEFLLDEATRRRRSATAILNAVAGGWSTHRSPQGECVVTAVVATGPAGREVTVKCRLVVVAAGTIESTRLLLELQEQSNALAPSPGSPVGLYLSDHLSCSIAEVLPGDVSLAARRFAPRFDRRRMRTPRFIRRAEDGWPRGFFHLLFEQSNPGFEFARKVLAGLQSHRVPKVGVVETVQAMSGLAGLVKHRIVNHTLYVPPTTPAHIQLDMEQTPAVENRIELGRRRDRWHRRVPVISWSIAAHDLRRIAELAGNFVSAWGMLGPGYPRLRPVSIEASDLKPYDAFHPVGTCRMGPPGAGVVGLDLKVHGASNVYVLSTGVFPSAGTANPTFSMLCLGEGLSDHLAARLGEGRL